jgi:hypothetical protein
MADRRKTKRELIMELEQARERVMALEAQWERTQGEPIRLQQAGKLVPFSTLGLPYVACGWDVPSGRVALKTVKCQDIGFPLDEHGFGEMDLKQIEEIIHPGDRALFTRKLREWCSVNSGPFSCELVGQPGSGTWRWIWVNRGKIRTDDQGRTRETRIKTNKRCS